LRFADGASLDTLDIRPGDKLEIDAPADSLTPRCNVAVRIVRADGSVQSVAAKAAVETQLECRLLRSGGVIPLILQQQLETQEA
jgi:aconitate hydratase